MKPSPVDYFGEFDDPNSTMAMDVDDIDALEFFGDGSIAIDNKLADADFFNAFEDDFDDSDIS
ncbi:small acidic protein 1 [Impatiens glandulifera]|uniref:small acidic protein 1 n=1 Tax=Impatiens glandulifera TaxID=253017 RepID=UPI001FB127C9|nr:small acidic protein 1 [Impatiens glandulifera]